MGKGVGILKRGIASEDSDEPHWEITVDLARPSAVSVAAIHYVERNLPALSSELLVLAQGHGASTPHVDRLMLEIGHVDRPLDEAKRLVAIRALEVAASAPSPAQSEIIATGAMFEVLINEAIPLSEEIMALVDGQGRPVRTLEQASMRIREAIRWLLPLNLVQVESANGFAQIRFLKASEMVA